MSSFVHLHVHSEYSLLDGAARIKRLAKQAAHFGMPALALTDHGVMYGAIPFYKACLEVGVKPIIGCEVYVAARSMHEKGARQDHPTYHLVLLARNETGYRNLMKLTSAGFLHGFHYKPRIDFALLEKHAEGLICLSACLIGEVPQLLLQGKDEEARATALRYKALFGEDYFLEMQDHQLLDQRRVNPKLMALAADADIPLVVTNDVHYIEKSDAQVQDLLLCIGTGKTIDDPLRMKMDTDQMYFKSGAEMATLFPHVPQALANTLEIAARCRLELAFDRTLLPTFSTVKHTEPHGQTESADAFLQRLCADGLKWRFAAQSEWTDLAFQARARDRLEYELDVITKMGYTDYFLIVWDLLRFAHEQGIAVGPGRGSSAGSLVAYVLNITNVDPLRYGLLFERFLNPERVSMPDIDMDLSDERRGEVIQYATEKYGADRVAQIATFGTLASRMAVRDTGRALNLPFYEVDKAAKLIGEQTGSTIEAALAESAPLRELAAQSVTIKNMLDFAQKIEGMPRNISTHAAGIVIAPQPLTDFVPLQQGSQETPLTQYSMEHVEAVGLVKIDFLGLRTLSVMERAIAYIQRDFGQTVDFEQIPDDDPLTYEMLGRGETLGVFQLESSGMRRVLRDLRPSRFEDLISVLALFRPGPMEFIPQFIKGKHGQIEVTYPHPDLEPILRDTYGIIVYQEQIMQIANRMAGFSLGQADLLRRAVSKKKRDILDEQRQFFVAGSVTQGYSETDANKVYDLIVRFADYGFPRAHATAYAVLAFRTAWLRAHFPGPFMASMMTAVVHSQEKIGEYVEACKTAGIRVLPPDVNESGLLFTTSPQGTVRFGLAAIKHVGYKAVEAIIQERQVRPFSDLVDFCRRIDLSVCNKRVIEALILGGAMDGFPQHRAQLIAVLDEIVEDSVKWKKQKSQFELDLFGFKEEQDIHFEYPEVRPYPVRTRLENEKELMGVYLSGHPLDDHAVAIGRLKQVVPLEELRDYQGPRRVRVVGIVLSVRTIVTKKGQPMAFVELENKVTKCELTIFPRLWEKARALVQEGAVLVVEADVEQEEEAVKLLAAEITPLDKAVEKAHRQSLMIKLAVGQLNAQTLAQLEITLGQSRGSTPVVLFDEAKKEWIELDRRFAVRPNANLIASLERLVGQGAVKLT